MSPVRVLLLWPGCEGAAAGNFGVPQLVLLASYARAQTGASVEIRDLACEAALGGVDISKLLAGDDGRGYDVIGISVYASFDALKCQAIAEIARAQWPDAVLVAGGYHPSSRPEEYVGDDDGPWDVVVVGEGERPLAQVIESVAGGAPMRHVVLGPDPIAKLDELPPADWSLLARYRGIARRVASQAQVYLSRGCPFDCAFCMERAKRETSWRALSVERALAEVESLHRFLDLRSWTLYFGDALFGMKTSWRRAFLEGLARLDLPVDKYWLLIRVDLVDEEDLRLFGAANCGLGFGLESGDPDQLAIIRKSGRLDDYLDRMEHIAAVARRLDVPWGANVICGHPGETEASMRRSAAWLSRLFGREGGVTGFLSVDPFRLYPGSPIDAERGLYEARYGTRFHRPRWWDDGDPAFLSEWVDPSAELDWATRERLQHELLGPVLAGIEGNFAYAGKARPYFLRAIREQVQFAQGRARLWDRGRYYAWQSWLGRRRRAEAERGRDATLAELCRAARQARMAEVCARAQLAPEGPIAAALVDVARERFVPIDQVEESTKDIAIALDDSGAATISAMHAYARSFALLDVGPGDAVLDLGAGTGYGTAILHRLVGADGRVVAIEIDPALIERTAEILGATAIVCGDALDPASWPAAAHGCRKITVGFTLDGWPAAWTEALPPGTVVVAPLREGEVTRLVRVTLGAAGPEIERFEPVSYVAARREVVRVRPNAAAPVHLPVVD